MPRLQTTADLGAYTLITLGSNAKSRWGTSFDTVLKAMSILEKLSPIGAMRSALYRTPAFPAGAGPDFVNAAIRLQVAQSPDVILATLHEIEAEAGRERVVRWGQRTLDLDLIAHADAVLPDNDTHAKWRDLSLEDQMESAPDQLVLPHPRLQDRSFVLVPLADIAPDWVHPILGLSVTQMRDARPKTEIASVCVI